jgi:hypothetical protein
MAVSPRPGLVFHYNYLWRHEHHAGMEGSPYSRPCVVIVAVSTGPSVEVVLAPITHRAPSTEEAAVEVPARVKANLGLDDQRSWIITNDLNHCAWPSPDLEPIPGGPNKGEWSYGTLPPRLFDEVRQRILAQPPSPTRRGP